MTYWQSYNRWLFKQRFGSARDPYTAPQKMLAPVLSIFFSFLMIGRVHRFREFPKRLPTHRHPSTVQLTFESAITKVLGNLEQHNLIHDRLFGFSRQQSTADLLIKNIWDNALQSPIVAFDIAKTYDRVWRTAVLPTSIIWISS